MGLTQMQRAVLEMQTSTWISRDGLVYAAVTHDLIVSVVYNNNICFFLIILIHGGLAEVLLHVTFSLGPRKME